MQRESHVSRMPMSQLNAHVDDGLLIRVGIPHRGGKLAFHAFNEDFAGMVSASAFWNPKTGRFRIPEQRGLYRNEAVPVERQASRDCRGLSVDDGTVRRTRLAFRRGMGLAT
ncbi:hypothetical protein [Paraburkholderia sp. LEh10]|uniref:hypothetical protein n=1 Tax=Paraburkholderia sp. LEh10 TaxID=2821353 RepID=UPI001AE759FA|nr:hypothetical protein [Paraburkholderia sp. LEh10]